MTPCGRLGSTNPGRWRWKSRELLGWSIGAIFRSRKWHDILQDQKHQVVTTGLGNFEDWITWVRRLRRRPNTLVHYMPTARSITVDLSKIQGKLLGHGGLIREMAKQRRLGSFQQAAPKEFTPPGAGDWAFVLDDASGGIKRVQISSPI